jgi:hypothetical protein
VRVAPLTLLLLLPLAGCGNGITAMRVVSIATTAGERALAAVFSRRAGLTIDPVPRHAGSERCLLAGVGPRVRRVLARCSTRRHSSRFVVGPDGLVRSAGDSGDYPPQWAL